MEWLIYPLLGVLVGLTAGLFGVGGGAVIVPTLIIIFGVLGFDSAYIVHVALGTSFATIVVTAVSAIWSHHRRGNIDWTLWRALTPGLLFGVTAGSLVAMQVDGGLLQPAVAALLMLIALQMFTRWQPRSGLWPRPGALQHGVAGAVIGGVSAFMGIGGGSMTVPWLTSTGEQMKTAVATSSACGLPIAIAGTFSYGLLASVGFSTRVPAGDIQWLTGYIYWPAFIGIVLTSIPFAGVGAGLASRLPERQLKQMFALLLFVVSAYLFFSA